MAAVETRTLVFLAPVYPDVCNLHSSVPVALQRTNDDWLKLVFSSSPNTFVEKEAICVNSHAGCRCDYVRLLRALMVLTEREVLSVVGDYNVATTGDHRTVATLRMHVQVHRHASVCDPLHDFHLILCHLQAQSLSIVRKSMSYSIKDREAQLTDATRSSCHVVGCRLHAWKPDANLGPKPKLHLSDVFQSLMTDMEAERKFNVRDKGIRGSPTVQLQPRLTTLLKNALHIVVCFLKTKDVTSLARVCSVFQPLVYEVVPGLNLVLHDHQQMGLRWMLNRERPSRIENLSMLHPFIFPRQPGKKSNVAVHLVDHKVVEQVDTRAFDMCGGMFCDEPGLGKTITMLAMILRTKRLSTSTARNVVTNLDEDAAVGRCSIGMPDRSIPAEHLVTSNGSLIVVPDPLVEHWKYQIEAHVARGALRTFVDEGRADLPRNVDLAAYDVVVTSFRRLTTEWRLHRPASALETRMPERYGFEGPQRYADGTNRGEVSSLLTVQWTRVIIDEGHKLGGRTPTNLMLMARIISAKRRWVMTGTPTPNTLQSADLRFMHGLLVFLQIEPYGQPDGRAWTKAIARPFEQNEPIGFFRLQSLLSRIMMRHTKESIREILPEPTRHTVFIDPTPSEYAQYNVIAAAVRANLVITNMDPKHPGKLHLDSLLNPTNRKEALRVVSNLRFACCGGVNSEVVLSDKALLETVNMLTELEVDADNIATVAEYLRRVKLPGMTTTCECCKRKLQLLMVMPCGHLCCADCVEDRFNEVGPSCYKCNEVYDPEVFQELQPGFDFREIDDANDAITNTSSSRHNANRPQQQQPGTCDRGGQRQHPAASGSIAREQPQPNRHYWTVDASKIFYAATRVRQLKNEFARCPIVHGSMRCRQTRFVKVIIFSQFTEIIWRTKLAFEQQEIPTANFITRVNPKARMKALKRFRTDPSLNVLLLSEMGSHGLDLSFVTHVFLMEEIWDKSLEQQVVSRAHRMGAQQAVVVEQLWMRGSVESEMAKMNELDERHTSDPPRVMHRLGPPVRTRKRLRVGGKALLNVAGTKRRKRNRRGDAKKVPIDNKSSFLQRKLDYVLRHLRLLENNAVAEPGQVRFSVVDEKAGVTVRQAIQTVQYPDTPATTPPSSTPLRPREKRVPASQLTQTSATHQRMPTAKQAVRTSSSARQTTDNRSSAHRSTSNVADAVNREQSRDSTKTAVENRPAGKAKRHSQSAQHTISVRPVAATSTRQVAPNTGSTVSSAITAPPTTLLQNKDDQTVPKKALLLAAPSLSPARVRSEALTEANQRIRKKRPDSRSSSDSTDITRIRDASISSQLQPQLPTKPSLTRKIPKEDPEIIVIDCSLSLGSEGSVSKGDAASVASSNCSADNEDSSESGDSDNDSEAEVLLTRLCLVAKHIFGRKQRRTIAVRKKIGTTPVPEKKAPPAPYIDDEETETE
uniref:Uncharacterized protein n=1 Tax=Peronospora matthiolae TaxID=2874970 RepID=A0AAV1T4R0_9STRA